MKVLVITGSRADRNGLEVVHDALLKAGHESEFVTAPRITRMGWSDGLEIAVLGGDRSEVLLAAAKLAIEGMPIAHIAGGDLTAGSADDRYRDAITALARIHFATNNRAFHRLLAVVYGGGVRRDDVVMHTGSPAIDRIKQTPIHPDKSDVLSQFCMRGDKPVALVCVHPNTDGGNAFADFNATIAAIRATGLQGIFLGANADSGGEAINDMLAEWCANQTKPVWSFHHTVSPQMYYSLMAYCDVMVGNSSAMLYEAPCFGLPCVLVGTRQRGRVVPDNIWEADSENVVVQIEAAMADGHFKCDNPYGDGHSTPRIVKALEEWHELRQGVGGRARVAGDAL